MTLLPARVRRLALKRRLSALVVADADRLVNARYEYLAVAYVTGARRGDDRVDHLFCRLVVYHQFQLHLRQQINRVFPSPVELGMTLLPAVTARLQNRHALHANFD